MNSPSSRLAVPGFSACVLLLAVSTAPLTAQVIQFAPQARSTIPTQTNFEFDVAVGDVDGDRNVDFVVAITTGQRQNALYSTDGDGNLADRTAQLPPDLAASLSVALGDVDGDGDLDIVFGNSGQNFLYLNNGRGVFTDVTGTNLPSINDWTYSVALADLDGDKDLDVVVANRGAANHLLINNGKGTFTQAALNYAGNSAATWGVRVGDVDGDLDQDIFFTNHSGASKLLINNGKGFFTDQTVARWPQPSPAMIVTCRPALGDVDGDGDLDVYVAAYNQQDRLWTNNGKGVFTDVTASHLPAATWGGYGVEMGDMDLDGDLDIVVGNWSTTGGQLNRILLNNGKGIFTDGTSARMSAIVNNSVAIALADIDSDGDLDIFSANWGRQNTIQFNHHRQTYAAAKPVIGTTYSLDFTGMPGYANKLQMVFPYLGLRPLKSKVWLPPLGFLGVDPAFGLVPLPSGVIPVPGGKWTLRISIPNDPQLKVPFVIQAVMGPLGSERLSNTWRDKF